MNESTPKTPRRFDKEFKVAALELWRTSGKAAQWGMAAAWGEARPMGGGAQRGKDYGLLLLLSRGILGIEAGSAV